MADQAWNGVALAVGVQAGLGQINTTIRDLTGSIDSTDGIVLGDRESGEANSGIVLPTHERIEAALADIGFTRQPGSFQRLAVNGLAITTQAKGNGAQATPGNGEAKPHAGLDALLQMSGLAGANGTAPEYVYTPAGATVYGTVKLWVSDLSYVYQDCVAGLQIVPTPGGICLVTFQIQVGSLAAFADGVTFPTLDYTTQASLSAPRVEGVQHTWSTVRGFNELTIANENEIAEEPDSNAATGVRLVQNGRTFRVEGIVRVDSTDSDFEHENVGASSAPTADMSFQLGTPAGASDTINGMKVECNNVQLERAKDVRSGTDHAKQIAGYCTAAVANGEFALTFN